MRSEPALFGLSVALAACNALVGVDDVVLDESAGSTSSGLTTSSSGAGPGGGVGPMTSSGPGQGGAGPTSSSGAAEGGGGGTTNGTGGSGGSAVMTSSSSSGAGGAGDCIQAGDAGLVAHWVAEDAIDGLGSGDDVVSWPARVGGADLSVVGNAAPPTVAVDDIDGYPLVSFLPGAGPNQILGGLLSHPTPGADTEVTIVAVARWLEMPSNQQVLAHWGNPATRAVYLGKDENNPNKGNVFQVTYGGAFARVTGGSGEGNQILIGMRKTISGGALPDQHQLYGYQNGFSTLPGGAPDFGGDLLLSSTSVLLGANELNGFGFQGMVAEVAIYTRALPPDERVALESCLSLHYDIPVAGAVDGCENGIQSGTETDVDCGGGSCTRCRLGAVCSDPTTDCASGFCSDPPGMAGADTVCVPGISCTDPGDCTSNSCEDPPEVEGTDTYCEPP